jgi:hypothetical protein
MVQSIDFSLLHMGDWKGSIRVADLTEHVGGGN